MLQTNATARVRENIEMPSWMMRKLGFIKARAENRDSFFERIAEIFPPTDDRYKMIERAYTIAKNAFRQMRRDDGERYFEHLRAVTLIVVVHLRVRDPDIIVATLLHDIIEDIRGWTFARVAREFNERVATLVWWVSKPSGARFRTPEEVDRKYHRNLLRAPRDAIIIKTADRLHNLTTIWGQDEARVRRKIAETRDFILPLAEMHQLLIHELEDMLRFLERKLQ